MTIFGNPPEKRRPLAHGSALGSRGAPGRVAVALAEQRRAGVGAAAVVAAQHCAGFGAAAVVADLVPLWEARGGVGLFGRANLTGLVLGCIEAKFWKKICV